MSRRRQLFLLGGIMAVLTGVVVASSRVRAPEAVEVGSRAPDFQAKTVDGTAQVKGLGDYRGRLVLLNVWATWCEPCQREMPSIERLYRELGPRGLKVVAVSIDDGGAQADIREFVKEHGLTFDILHDPTGGIMRAYQMIGVPQSFLIGPDGTIQKKAFETDWYAEENRYLVARLLGGKS